MTGSGCNCGREHTVEADDEAVEQSADLEELMRNAGVIELPDSPAEPPQWLDTGTGPGWPNGTAWERHDDPEQQP
ncbi:hypothetical protein GCM10009789_87670 [Kribbella sancticallisti]|uniref:Uncharacterized protein n=1 Tax=Kribbella sancticallisti TaxID=460087 RepID=A0ABN2EX50_9ACTN